MTQDIVRCTGQVRNVEGNPVTLQFVSGRKTMHSIREQIYAKQKISEFGITGEFMPNYNNVIEKKSKKPNRNQLGKFKFPLFLDTYNNGKLNLAN